MRFTSKEDIRAPIEFVFDQITDFATYEAQAVQRGIRVRRVDDLQTQGAGMRWIAEGRVRGKMREFDIEVISFDPPNGMMLASAVGGLRGTAFIDLVPLSRNLTRLSVDIDLKPSTISARLVLQSLRLAKRSITKRFKLRVAQYAGTIQDSYSRRA